MAMRASMVLAVGRLRSSVPQALGRSVGEEAVGNKDVNKPYPGREARDPGKSMGKKGFKVVNLLRALNILPHKPDNKRDRKGK